MERVVKRERGRSLNYIKLTVLATNAASVSETSHPNEAQDVTIVLTISSIVSKVSFVSTVTI